MKYFFSEKEQHYDGTQLKHLFAYLNHNILGDSIVAWVGSCEVSFEHMADGEDLLAQAEIKGSKMLHFIIEKFNIDFYAGVSLQRLLASLCQDVIREISPKKEITQFLRREGDDLFFENKKLSISIAKKMVNSVVIHFAVNVSNVGTPVPTLSIEDLAVDPRNLAEKLMTAFITEDQTITEATQKVL